AQDVVCLRKRVSVLRAVRKAERLDRETLRAWGIAGAMRGQAPVGEDPRLLTLAGAGSTRDRVVPLRVRPIAAPMVDLRELVLERDARGRGRFRDRRLVALDRSVVVAVERVQVADRLRGGCHGCRPV